MKEVKMNAKKQKILDIVEELKAELDLTNRKIAELKEQLNELK